MDYIDLLGKKFQYNTQGPEHFDCKGLAFELYRRAGLFFPMYESSSVIEVQNELFIDGFAKYFKEIANPEPYSLVAFRIKPPYVTHIGVVMQDSQRFIHIMPRSSVTVERLDSLLWANKIAGFYRSINE